MISDIGMSVHFTSHEMRGHKSHRHADMWIM